jgi:hypothetical protein
MADDYKTKWEKFLQEAVREAVKEQLGYTDGELEDAEAFLAIPATEPEDPQLATWKWINNCNSGLFRFLSPSRWGDFSYSDYAFAYDVGISLDKEDGDLL